MEDRKQAINGITQFTLATAPEICEVLGARLRTKRKALGLSRPALSKKSGVSLRTITRFEASGIASTLNLVKLLIALGEQTSLGAVLESGHYSTMEEFIKAHENE